LSMTGRCTGVAGMNDHWWLTPSLVSTKVAMLR
jgi:hypothetical protein